MPIHTPSTVGLSGNETRSTDNRTLKKLYQITGDLLKYGRKKELGK